MFSGSKTSLSHKMPKTTPAKTTQKQPKKTTKTVLMKKEDVGKIVAELLAEMDDDI